MMLTGYDTLIFTSTNPIRYPQTLFCKQSEAKLTTQPQDGVVLCHMTTQQVVARLRCRPNDRHTSLALYILLRGATLIIRCGNKPDAPPAIRKALTPTRWKHGDTVLMCVATSQILYSWIMMPHTLPPTYIKFLNRHGGRQQWHYNAARVCISHLTACVYVLMLVGSTA